MTAIIALNTVAAPLGFLLAGQVIERVGTSTVFYTVAAGFTVGLARLRRGRPPPPADAGAGAGDLDGYASSVAEFRTSDAYRPTGDQPEAIETLAESIRAGNRFQTLLGRDRHGQDGDDGLDDREGRQAGADHRPQQDARGPALQRVPRVLPRELRRVLRLVLRLLPARGVRAPGRPLHREGLVPERRHLAPAARGDVGADDAARRRHRRLRLLHLRASARRRSGRSAC